MGDIAAIDTGDWTPQQVLADVMGKVDDVESIAIVIKCKSGGWTTCLSRTNGDTAETYFKGAILQERAMRLGLDHG